jgi:hypothetical protein
MNFKAIAMVAILGLSAPAIVDVASSSQAVAATQFNYPTGFFGNAEIGIGLDYSGNTYRYKGPKFDRSKNITLLGAETSGTYQRQVYTWYRDEYRYQIAWRPNDPGVVRLQIFSPSGKELLNCLLYEDSGN